MSYNVELVEKKEPIEQLEASNSSIKVSDLLNVDVKKIQAKRRNRIYSCLFQFNNKNCDKS